MRSSRSGNTSEYMSTFYHLRNALAHGRFAVFTDPNNSHTLVFEDHGNRGGPSIARGIIGLERLIGMINILRNGPDMPNQIENAILDAIEAGHLRRRGIVDYLEIPNSDWRIFSGVHKKEGKTVYDKHERSWYLTSVERITGEFLTHA